MEEKKYLFTKNQLIEVCALCCAEAFGYTEHKIGKSYSKDQIEHDMLVLMEKTVEDFLAGEFLDDV